MKRIICVGNPLLLEDRGGREVFDCLSNMPLPDDVEVIDGGLRGLDLLRFVEGAERIVFVDCVSDDETRDGLVVLDRESVAACCEEQHYQHAAGLPYLLRILPHVLDGNLPPICLVGIAPCSESRAIGLAAAMCLRLVASASTGVPGNARMREPA